jgi:two-component system, chemotaxis family, protein-glutamate methylesterase/glutaminase
MFHLKDLPKLLDGLVRQPAGEPVAPPDKLRYEVEIAKTGRASIAGMDWFGGRSALTCPDCGGVMWHLKDGALSRHRCHIGHAYAEEQMVAGLDDNLKRAMATALRELNERVALVGKLRDKTKEVGQAELAESWTMRAQEFQREADEISEAIRRLDRPR